MASCYPTRSEPSCGVLAESPRRGGEDTTGRVRRVHRQQLIERATEFERAGALQVFQFEQQRAPRKRGEFR